MPIDWPKDASTQSDDDDTSSLGSYLSSSDDSFDSEDQSALIQEEWEESMRQIEAVLSVIILPFFGKWWGRRFAFWGESDLRWRAQSTNDQRMTGTRSLAGRQPSLASRTECASTLLDVIHHGICIGNGQWMSGGCDAEMCEF